MTEESILSEKISQEVYKEDLLLDWILSTEEIQLISASTRGYKNRLYFALQYKHLQLKGYFLEKIEDLPKKIISALARQLELDVSNFVKVHRNSKAAYRKEISDYLGYKECTKLDYSALEQFVFEEMSKDFLSEEELRNKVYQRMRGLKLLRPSEYNFNRKLKYFRLKALESLYLKIADKLSMEQRNQVLSGRLHLNSRKSC